MLIGYVVGHLIGSCRIEETRKREKPRKSVISRTFPPGVQSRPQHWLTSLKGTKRELADPGAQYP